MTVIDFNDALSQRDAWKQAQLDVDQIRQAVTARARDFVLWLLPAAVVHRSGRYAVVGDIQGSPGESLHIELTGPKAGYWKDWAANGDEGKDLIGLFMASMGLDRIRDFGRALEQIGAEFLGETTAPAWSRPVTYHLQERAKEHEGKPRPSIDDRPPPSETYVYETHDRKIIGLVRRHDADERDAATGKPRKTFSVWCTGTGKAQAPTPRPLYRIPEIVLAGHVVFVEGERKANALASVGIESTCIMFGSSADFGKVDWSPIAGKLVTVWPDNDPSGQSFADRLVPHLLTLKCRVARIRIPAGAAPKWDAADALAEGHDLAALVEAAEPVVAPPGSAPRPSARITLLDIDEIENMPAPAWLIDGILTKGGLSLTWGKSGALKSFVAADMALCIATGHPWQGRAVQQGLVIYVAAEGAYGLARRIVGWRRTKGRDLPKPSFRLVPHTIALTGEDLQHLIAAIVAIGEAPVLIVLDTLARTFGAGDENRQADMNAYVTAADRLREATGANVMIVHHSGVHEESRERGSNVLRGAADTVINVTRRNQTKLEIINQAPKGKQKDADEFPTIKLRTQKVSFTLSSDPNAEHTTLVLMGDDDPIDDDTDDTDEAQADAKMPKLGPVQKAILAALREAGMPLGFTRLKLMTNVQDGSLGRSLVKLEENDLIRSLDDNCNNRLWELV